MKDQHDLIVDTILEGLRKAQAPSGMESRIVDVLQHHACTASRRKWPRWKTIGLVTTAALATVILGSFVLGHRPMRVSSRTNTQANTIPVNNELRPALVTSSRKTVQRSVRKLKPQLLSTPKRDVALISYPAPPMPLTEQEKLLIRLAHKGDPVQLAMLDPVQRAAEYAEERAQVQRFFRTAHTGDNQ